MGLFVVKITRLLVKVSNFSFRYQTLTDTAEFLSNLALPAGPSRRLRTEDTSTSKNLIFAIFTSNPT
jgi:hypothetical protein